MRIDQKMKTLGVLVKTVLELRTTVYKDSLLGSLLSSEWEEQQVRKFELPLRHFDLIIFINVIYLCYI